MKLYTLFATVCLTITGCQPTTDCPTPDNSPTNADEHQTLVLQEEITEIMTTDPEDNLHLYQYLSDRDQTVSLRITLIDGPTAGRNAYLQVAIQTSDGEEIAFPAVNQDNSQLRDIALSAGESVSLELSSFGIFQSEFYRYSIELLPTLENALHQDPVSYEPNNTLSIAHPLKIGQAVTSELMLGSTDQYDIYSIDASAGGIYTISLINRQGSGSSTSGGLRLDVLDETGAPLVQQVDFQQYEGEHFMVTPERDGKMFIRISSPIGTIFQNNYFQYQLSVWPSVSSVGVDSITNEPNDSPALAIPVALEETVNSDLQRGPTDFVDCYAAELTAGKSYTLTVSALDGPNRSNEANLRLKVLSRDGNSVLLPEQRIAHQQTQTFTLQSLVDSSAIIQLYYKKTLGHELNYHQYRFTVSEMP